jgi:predicted O-methyltransferase YrrM
VHSPFVYDLITLCFHDQTKYPDYFTLNTFRKKLYSSQEEIEIADFGAGSRVFKSNKRKIAAIAKNSGISSKRQKLLYRLVCYFKPERILELGTSLGLATAALSLGNTSARVQTVEGCPNTAAKAQTHFDGFNLKNIQLQTKLFDEFLSENSAETYDLCYIDGNHNKEKTLDYFELLLKQVANDTLFIFDDIYWSQQMTEAWQEIIRHPKVTVSIDTFYWGFVFFRSEQQKEHFKIRL